MLHPFINVADYNKITDTIMTIGSNCVLKFNVILNSENKNTGEVENFHKEFQYYSKRFSKNQYSIFRKFDYFLSIENYVPNDNGFRETIQIGVCEITMAKYLLNSVMEWFLNPDYKDLYSNKDGRLVITREISPKKVFLRSKYIEIEPIVYIDADNNTDIGVRMYLNSETNYCEMSFSRFCGLHYMIDSFNLYESAIILINYIQRPELGTNLISFIDNNPLDLRKESTGNHTNKVGRRIENNNVFTKKQNLEDSLG